MPTVAFNRTPTNLRVPFFYAEVNAGTNYYEGNSRLLLVGQMLQGKASGALNVGAAGNGAITMAAQPVLVGGALGAYTVTFTSATAFTVKDPSGNPVGAGAVGTAFANKIAFTIAAGGTAFVAGDGFTVTVARVQPMATPNEPILIDHLPTDLFGFGSMLVEMVAFAQAAYSTGEIWALPLLDPPGVAATATITPIPPGTSGTLYLYVCGQLLEVQVLSTDTAAIMGADIAAAINAGYTTTGGVSLLFPMTATADPVTGVVTCTANHAGTVGNLMSIDKDLVGDEGPFVSNITIANFGSGANGLVAGTGIPLLNAGLAALGDDEYDWIAGPYADVNSLNSMRDFLSDTGGRWDPMKQIYGHYITVNFGTLSAQSTLGATRNDQHTTIMPVVESPTSPWNWAASIGGIILLHKNLGADIGDASEISRPLQTLLLPQVLPPKNRSDYWDIQERQVLYFDGLSGFTVGRDGQVYLDRVTTTYQTNAFGQNDTTWLDVDTIAQCVYALRFMRQYISQKHPRDALVDDNPNALQGFTTTKDLNADVIHAFAALVGGGVMKNLPLFAQNVITQQSGDPNRVNCYLPLDVVNQLRVFAANATVFLDAAASQ